jgi:hypothetical protein
MVVVVTVAPPENGVKAPTSGAAGPARQVAAQPPLTDPDAFDVSARLSAAPGAAEKTVDAEVGDRVQIVVESPAVDSVAIGDLAQETLEPDSPARFELLADTPGSYPVVLLNEERQIGILKVH